MTIPFSLMDKDNDEKITAADFKAFMLGLGDKGDSLDMIEQIFIENSYHGDGSITVEEFQRLIMPPATTGGPPN